MELTPHLVSSNRLERYNVVNAEAEDLGQVQNFMLDIASGKIAYVVVSFGGFMGISDKWFAIPWEAMTWSPETKRFVLDMSKEALKEAPGLDKKHWQEEIDMNWLGECSEFYGCPVTWHVHEIVHPETPVVGVDE
jgi:sporulation protein YlmC with PRC-barrel domain